MRGYVLRFLCLGLLGAMAAAAVFFASQAGQAAAAEVLPPKPPAAETEVSPPLSEEKPEESLLLLRSETARESVSLYSDTWELQASLRLDAAGEGTVPRPDAGSYRLIRADGRVVRFLLDSEGGVHVTDGTGYGSGGMLMLTEKERGSVELRYHTAEADGVVCRIEGNGSVHSGELARQDAETAVLTFPGLEPGTYQVYVGGEWVITVELAAYAMDRRIELY